MKKVKLALLGAGKLGGYHAGKIAVSEISELTGIYDPLPENGKRLADKYAVPLFNNPDEAISKADGVVVAAPTVEHAQLGLLALRAGKHLLMEKPLAVTAVEAAELRNEAAVRNLVIQTGHTEEFNPAWREIFPTLKQMTSAGPVLFSAVRTSPYSFRCTDVGVVLDVMIHDLELVISAVGGSRAVSVSASVLEEFGGHEDLCSAEILFENGSSAHFFASRTEREARREMKIFGRGKRIFLDFAARRAEIVSADSAVLAGEYRPGSVRYTDMLPEIPEFMKKHYSAELTEKSPVDPLEEEERQFAESIIALQTAPVDYGAEAVALAEQILKAAK